MKDLSNRQKVDFSKGPVWKCILAQAVPLTIAQLVQLLYNVVDRIYIGLSFSSLPFTFLLFKLQTRD